MITQRIASSSSFTCSWTYSVFLNFRGIDTRCGFTGHLYKALCDKGIETFMDDEKLQKGGKITPGLVKAIEESRITIVIFSKNYAASNFCLEELVKIIELMELKHRLVWPVFYEVDPSDVRYQKGSFGQAFNRLIQKRFKNDEDMIQKWKSALKAAADLSGWHFFEENHFEYKLIDQIIKEVSKRTSRIPLHVANYPVGLESQVQEVKTLLETESDKAVNMVGIYGIGGIGKTTIACAMYNLIADHFEGVCFLCDIRENSITKHDLVELQEKLLMDILGEKDIKLGSVNEGTSIIKHKLQNKKVLLILDDVNKSEQLKALAGELFWFGFGSKIIITTRDKHLLDSHHVEKTHEVVGLNDKEALELFSWNAFQKAKADPSYMDLSRDAISYSNGLPLALEVIGSNLCKRSRDVWESALRQYRKIPNTSIYEVLKVSYDSLEEHQKKIFLDMACFFKGAPLNYVTDILLYGRDLDPAYGIQELLDKSLVKIDRLNRVRMHDLIQDMGREIVRQESPLRPGKRSRLWYYEDIICVLERNTGSESIEVIMVNMPRDEMVHWDGLALKKMKNLQVLIVISANFSAEIKHLPTSLRLFEWVGYPFLALPSNFFPRNLVTLNLSDSCFISDIPLKKFESLCHLNLSGNRNLIQGPDISGAPNLKQLELNDCLNLTGIHDSVGIHRKLEVLDAARCSKLSVFPHQIIMKSLKFLNLSHCSSLKFFPEVSGKMENLVLFNLDHSGIESIPFSVQNLVGLKRIRIQGCNGLLWLPSSIFALRKLEGLSVGDSGKFHFYCNGDGEEQERVSPSVHSGMRFISLSNCDLRDDFLPTWLPCLSNLKKLHLECCNFTILPTRIKEIPFLECIQLVKCKKLREIGELPTSLKSLRLFECKRLREIRELPSNLVIVRAPNCKSLAFESSSKLLSEKFLEVRGKFIVLPGAKIPEWFDCCSKGQSMSFWFCKKFPSIALCAVVSALRPAAIANHLCFIMTINGTQKISRFIRLHEQPFMLDHILVFDLKTQMTESEADGLGVKRGWNHVEISCITYYSKEGLVKSMGVYVYKKETNMKDMIFMRPHPSPKR